MSVDLNLIHICWMIEWHGGSDSMSCHFFSPGPIFISFFPCQNPKDCFTMLYNLSVRSLTHKTHVIIPLWGLALSLSWVCRFIRSCTRKPVRQGFRGISQGDASCTSRQFYAPVGASAVLTDCVSASSFEICGLATALGRHVTSNLHTQHLWQPCELTSMCSTMDLLLWCKGNL